MNLTNSQWHLPVALLLISFAHAPKTLMWKIFDVSVACLVGATGPFCLVLPPLLLYFYAKHRFKWTLLLAGILACCAAVQSWFLIYSGSRVDRPLGITFTRFVRIFAGNIVGGTMIRASHYTTVEYLPLLLLYAMGALVIYSYMLCHAPTQMRMLVVFSLLVFAGALTSPAVNWTPRWEALVLNPASRYWFIPTLVLIWCVAWCAWNAKQKGLKRAARAWLLITVVVGTATGWPLKGYPQTDFRTLANRFESAAPGTVVVIPEAPSPDLTMVIRKR